MKRYKGISLISLLVIITIAIGSAVWWKHKTDADKKQKIADEQAKVVGQELQQLATQKQREADVQKIASDAEDQRKKDMLSAIASINAVRVRWDDAVKLAHTTARIALAGPVANLQSIKREISAMTVPTCLTSPKEKLAASMDTTINGFMQFMQDANFGKFLAEFDLKKANVLLTEYESGAASCTS